MIKKIERERRKKENDQREREVQSGWVTIMLHTLYVDCWLPPDDRRTVKHTIRVCVTWQPFKGKITFY